MSKPKRAIPAEQPDALFGRVVSILEQARGNVVRAGYGKQVLETLSGHLAQRYGHGFSVPNLRNFRKFYLAYSTRVIAAAPIQYPAGTVLGLPRKSHPAGDELPQGAPQ